MLSGNPNVSLKNFDFSVFTRRNLVAGTNHQILQWNLEKEPAHYNYMETIARAFIIPSRQNQFIRENVFDNAPIKNIAVARNTNAAVDYLHFRLSILSFERARNFPLSPLCYNNENNAVK